MFDELIIHDARPILWLKRLFVFDQAERDGEVIGSNHLMDTMRFVPSVRSQSILPLKPGVQAGG